MLNIHELEARHRKYKLKTYIPYTIVLVSLFIIVVLVYLFINKTQDSNKISTISMKKDKELSKLKEKNTVTAIENNKTIVKKEKPTVVAIKKIIKKEQISISPSMNFMKDIQSDKKSQYEHNSKEIKAEKPKIKKSLKQSVQTVVNEPIVEITPIQEPIKVKKIEKLEDTAVKKINISKTDQDIQHVIKRFKKNNNPALSLFIAKNYYKIGEYHKAYNYALITNELNNDIEGSWIVFAKSLVKLNEKEMAIKTLKKYVNTSHSSQAKILLDEILSGKFK
jgi:tetratricopeptide (TPR) repeat protein